jgi:hypothetical protein
MADSTITGLPAASTLGGTEVLPVVQSSTDKKATVQQVSDFTRTESGSDTLNIVQRMTHFQNGTGLTNTLFEQNGYSQVAGNSAALTPAIATAVTGYQKSVGAAWLVAATTAANYVAALIRGGEVVQSAVYGNTWTTGGTIQTILYASLMGYLPDGSNDVEYRYGFFYDGYYAGTSIGNFAAYATDPFASIDSSSADRSAAYFYVNKNSGYWICKSGSDANTETTTTTVLAAINVMRAFRVKVNTDGTVQFWIDGVLVATHSGNGVITTGKQLSEAVVTMHTGAVASNTPHGFLMPSIGFRAVLPSARTGFTFV